MSRPADEAGAVFGNLSGADLLTVAMLQWELDLHLPFGPCNLSTSLGSTAVAWPQHRDQ
jgi:hypothetical protein